jgi:hypothetical protein
VKVRCPQHEECNDKQCPHGLEHEREQNCEPGANYCPACEPVQDTAALLREALGLLSEAKKHVCSNTPLDWYERTNNLLAQAGKEGKA